MGPSLSILTTIILRYSFVQAYNEMMFTEPLIAAGESFTLTWTNSSSYIVNIWLFTVGEGVNDYLVDELAHSIPASDQEMTLIIPPSLVHADAAYYFVILAVPEAEWSPPSANFYMSGAEGETSTASAADTTTGTPVASASSPAADQSSASNAEATDSSQQDPDSGVPTGAVAGLAVGCTMAGIQIGMMISGGVFTHRVIRVMRRRRLMTDRAVQASTDDFNEEKTATQTDTQHMRDIYSGTTGQDGFWVMDPHTSRPIPEVQGDSRQL